jgi:hypothetical protein
MVLLELFLRGRLVGGDAEDNRAGLLDFLECVAEPARFQRSTRGVRLGIKEEHHVFAAIVLQGYRPAFFIGQRELGGFIINFHGFSVLITPMNLYSRRRSLASAVLLLAFAATFTAIHAQRRTPHKLRATALLEVTTDQTGVVSTRVVPITILDEGRFRDASIYKSTPRPMALENGIVYEAQKSGLPVGYVTIINGVNQGGWTALGKWQPVVTAKKSEPPPAATPTDERPILHRGGASPAPTPADVPAPEQTASQPVSAPPPEDPDRPVLRKRTPEKPAPSPTPAAAQPAPTPEGTVPSAPAPAFTPGTRTMAGISDNEASEGRSFEFSWKPGEEQQMQAKMIKLALAQLPRENTQLTPNSLKNVVMRGFDLDLSNDAVLVLSAEVPGSYLARGAGNTPGKFVSRYVTVIARVDFEGVPQKLASSVTDSTRLDVAPRLELIDAVDVDGDGLAELLFRQYSFDEKSFIIYGAGRGTVTKVFEGASMKLK